MTQTVDIRPGDLAIVQQILRDVLPPDAKIWVFGSRAKWTTKDSSDLDLAIDAGRPLLRDETIELGEAFEESDLPYKVDMVDWHSVADSFKAVIERDRVALPDTAPLSAFVDASRGITYGIVQPGQHDPSGIPILRVNNIRGGRILKHDVMRVTPEVEKKYQRTRLRGGEVLLTLVGTLGETAIVSDEQKGWNVARAVAVIPPAKGVSAKWLQICLGSAEVRHRIGSRATTTVQATLNLKDVAELPIYVPARTTKDYIEKTISALDDKIELNRKMNETLEAMARALFKSWFVDFDPVRAKMEGRTPDGLSDDLAALFPNRLTDSPIGPIPEGWGVAKVEDISKLVAMGPFGSSIKVSTFVEVGIPVISGQHLHEIMLSDGDYNFVSEEHATKLKNANVQKGDIVFTHAGSIGQVSYIHSSAAFERYVLSQRQFYLRCDDNKISKLYMLFYFKSHEGQHRLLANASQTGVPSIARPVTYLKQIPFIKPPKIILERFDKLSSVILDKMASNKSEIALLSALRDSLLPKLISGDLRVAAVDGALKEAI